MKQENHIDPVLLMLGVLMLIFTGVVISISHFMPNDGQTFQVTAGLLTATSGAFFGRITPKKKEDDVPLPPGVTEVRKQTDTSVHAEPPKQD